VAFTEPILPTRCRRENKYGSLAERDIQRERRAPYRFLLGSPVDALAAFLRAEFQKEGKMLEGSSANLKVPLCKRRERKRKERQDRTKREDLLLFFPQIN
jgi:hypothetical protein